MSYIYDDEGLPADKSNAVAVPSSGNPANYIEGSDYNALKQALEDTKLAVWKGGGRVAARATAPASGTFEKGDLVFNSNPADGSNVGWVCTVAGTPGTWLEFGVIASDVLNGGGSAPAGASDIADPERLFGTNKAELDLYPLGLGGGRKGQMGFITASTIDLTIKNENTGDADIELVPGGTGDVNVTGTLNASVNVVATGSVTGTSVNCNSISRVDGVSGGSNIPINTEEVRITGADEARLALYPDGSSTRKGYVGFDSGSNTLKLKNEETSTPDILLEPGGNGTGKLYVGQFGTCGIKSINVFTTTDNWSGKGSNSGDAFDYTVTGCAVGDIVLGVTYTGLLNASSGDGTFGHQLSGMVVASNQINITWRNYSGLTVEPISGTITIVWADLT